MQVDSPTFHNYRGISVSNNAAQAKLELQRLRLKKKELQLQLKGLKHKQTALRTTYTHQMRTTQPIYRGRGFLAKLTRAFQRTARYTVRATLADNLAPLTDQASRIEAEIIEVDTEILRVQQTLAS